jgi:hypothetical protein
VNYTVDPLRAFDVVLMMVAMQRLRSVIPVKQLIASSYEAAIQDEKSICAIPCVNAVEGLCDRLDRFRLLRS